MKKFFVVFAVLLIVTTSLFAGEVNIDKALKAYKIALEDGNIGLRSSALFRIAQVKSEYPETDFSAIENTLKKISRSDKSVMVKVQADLVLKYIQNDALSVNAIEAQENSVLFFNQLYDAVMANEITTLASK